MLPAIFTITIALAITNVLTIVTVSDIVANIAIVTDLAIDTALLIYISYIALAILAIIIAHHVKLHTKSGRLYNKHKKRISAGPTPVSKLVENSWKNY